MGFCARIWSFSIRKHGRCAWCVADGAPRSAQVVYEPGMGVTGQVFVTGKPVIVECLKGHPRFSQQIFYAHR